MNKIDKEKPILEKTPDFEEQRDILSEEKNEQERLKRFYFYIGGIFFCMLLIIVLSHFIIDIYIDYNLISTEACDNVNIDIKDYDFSVINIAYQNSCVPEYNVDYYNNRRATFNLDLYGDKTYIYNRLNQMDETGSYCILNCDRNADGWPDYNLDLNGDGTADINIVKPGSHNTCDLNCDLNLDTLPDTNIDLNDDGTADVNITDGDYQIPKYNIDYKGNRKPTFNIINADGTISNEVNNATHSFACKSNCDADGDGWPDYNIKLPDSDIILNEVISKGDIRFPYEDGKTTDWKCYHSKHLRSCYSGSSIPNNKYINIDVNGDGIPDVNVSNDHGVTIKNKLNNEVTINGKKVILNRDSDRDGLPDYNIDIDGDGLPDLNITKGNDNYCIKNCDTNYDGKADYKIEYNKNSTHQISIRNINLDIDFDGICDVNCDTNYDLYPDYNVDTTGDNMPDVNIDYDGDGVPDFNIDTDGDGFPDKNITAHYDGVCNWNCDDKENPVNHGNNCTVNCDTDDDGLPDLNVDLNGDGVCDINCDNGNTFVDKNGDYLIDSEDKTKDMIIDKNDKSSFYVLNPIDIVASDIEPGWEDIYVLTITNNTHYAMNYKLYWDEVINEFSDQNNLDYYITRNGGKFIDVSFFPREYNIIRDNILIRANTTVKYVLKASWKENGTDQSIDAGKHFKSKLRVETKK